MSMPLIALVMFIGVAAVHFGEAWKMLDDRLLRFASSAAIIAAPTICHPGAVAELFIAISDLARLSLRKSSSRLHL